MPQVPTGSHLRTYFSTEIMKTSQRHPNIRKPLCILAIPKSKINLALKMKMTPKSFRKQGQTVCLKIPSSIKSRNMYKSAHRFARPVNVLVSTWRVSLLKGAFGQTSVSPLFPHYEADFFADLLLVFGVIIRQVKFYAMSTFAYNLGTFV